MNLLKVLFSKLYIEGFVNQPSDIESAKMAIDLLHNFATVKNMNQELLDMINKDPIGIDIINMHHAEIKKLTDVSKYEPILKFIFDKNIKINTDVLTEKINTTYKNYAIKEGVMTKEQDLGDSIKFEDAQKLLTEIVKKPAVKEEVKEEPKKEVQENNQNVINEDENNIVNDNAKPAEDIINTNANAPTKEFVEFKAKLLEFAEYATKVENKDNTIKEMCNIIEGKKSFETAFQNYLQFINKETGPFDLFNKMVPEYSEPKQEQEALDNVIAYFATIANNGLNDKALGTQIKALNDGKLTVKDVFKTVQGILTPEQNTKFIESLSKGVSTVGMLTRMYQPLGDDYRVKIINNCTMLPNNDKYVPSGDEFYQFYYGDNPGKYDEHPLTENINKIIAANKDDAEYISILNEANQFVVKATDKSITETYSIAESTAALSQQNGTIKAVEYVNSKATDIPDLSRANKSTFSISTVYPPDAIENFIKADRVGKIVLESANDRMHPSKKDSDALKAIVKEIQDAKLFDFTHFSGEEGTKIYGLQALDRASTKITSAVNAENPNKDEIKTAVAEYKETKRIIDSILKKFEAFNYGNAIPSNVSVARTARMPGEYRANIVPVSRLNGLFVTMGLCNYYGININDFIDDPIKYQKELISAQFIKSKPATILENALNDIDAFDKFYSKETNYGNIQAMISAWGITRPGELISTTFAEDKEFERAMVLTSNLGGTLAESGDVFKTIYNNKGATLANLMIYRKEDINLFKLCPVKLDRIDPNTFQLMKEPTPLKDYIKNNYTLEELVAKLREVNKHFVRMYDKESIRLAVDVLSGAIKELDYPEETKGLLNDCLFESSPALDSVYKIEPTKANLDANFLDFYKKYSSLQADSLGYEKFRDGSMTKELELMAIKTPSEKMLKFYTEKVNEYIKTSGINLNKLGYEQDVKGISKFFYDYANNKFKDEYKVNLPEGLFDSLNNEARATYEKRIEVPQELIKNAEDKAKADYISSKFFGVNPDDAQTIANTEGVVEKKTTDIQKDAFTELVQKDPTLAPAVKFESHSASYKPLKDVHSEETIKLLDEVKVNEGTRNGILEVYNKMKEYGMLYGFNPTGEDRLKVYGFRKYNDAYENLSKALADKNLDKAYEIAQTCDEIKAQFHDVMDICERVFLQDGAHCSGNISISRNSYCPLDFSTRQQAMIQMNSIYMLANLCETRNYDIERVVKNPTEFIHSLLASERERLQNHFTKQTKGATLAALYNGDIIALHTAARGIEGLLNLESDPEQAKKNGLANQIFNGFVTDSTSIKNCFKMKDENGKYVPDINALKGYILENGSQSIDNYLVNNIDPVTGKLYQNSKTYDDIARDNDKDLSQVLQNTIKLLTDTLIGCVDLLEQDTYAYPPVQSIFAAASSVINDVIVANGLEESNSLVVGFAKKFMINPLETIAEEVRKVNPEYANRLNEVVNESLIAEATNKIGLFRSHSLTMAEEFNNRIENYDVDRIQTVYNSVKGPDNEIVTPNNLSDMLLMARKLNELKSNRGFFRRLLPAAGRERRLFNTIQAELTKANVDANLIDNVVNGDAINYPRMIAYEEQKLRDNKVIKNYSIEAVTNKVDSLLDLNTTQISTESLTELMKISKDIKDIQDFVKPEIKSELTKSLTFIQKSVEDADISVELQERIISGELTSEQAIFESAINDNRIREEIDDQEEYEEEKESMLDEEEMNKEIQQIKLD